MRFRIRGCEAVFCGLASVFVSANVLSSENDLDIALLRDLYIQSTSAVTSIEAEFERESVKPERRFVGKGRWVRDRDRILEEEVFEEHGIRSFDSFDGKVSYQAPYEKKGGAWEVLLIRKTLGCRSDLIRSHTLDSFLWITRNGFGSSLADLLVSDQARLLKQEGDVGMRFVLVDLGSKFLKSYDGATVRAEVKFAEQYGWLPVKIQMWAVGASEKDEFYRTQQWGDDGWISECEDWTSPGKGIWLPKTMRIRHGVDRDRGWDLNITKLRVNLDAATLSFLPPEPSIGTSLIDETRPGKPVVTIHREAEALSKRADEYARQIQIENKRVAGSPVAVASTGEGTDWRWFQRIALLLMCLAGVLYFKFAR